MEQQDQYIVNTGRYQISDEAPPRRYFYQTPNIIDDIDMSLIAHRLYCHLRRVAGDYGTCWQSTKTLGEKCHMSMGSVHNAREELESLGLINLERVKNPHGGKEFIRIVITDIWDKNERKFSSMSSHDIEPPPIMGTPSQNDIATSSGEIKNTTLRIPQTPGEIFENLNPETSEDNLMDKQQHREGVIKALKNGVEATITAGIEDYPADVRDVIDEFCKGWNLRPPRKCKHGGQYTYWIEGGRELLESCGEFGCESIRSYRKSFEKYMAEHQGIAPHTVTSPKSLVNMIRAEAGLLRGRASNPVNVVNVHGIAYALPPGRGEVWMGGQRVR